MLLGQSLEWFGQGIFLLIGLLLLLGLGGMVGLAIWTGLKMWIWHVRRERAEQEWFDSTHRADGQRYPAHTVGVCERCGEATGTLYCPEKMPAVCPACYEILWPEVEKAALEAQLRERSEKQADTADHEAGVPESDDRGGNSPKSK